MNKIDPKQAAIFIVVFLVIAVLINCVGAFGCSRKPFFSSSGTISTSPPSPPPQTDPAVEIAAKTDTEKVKFKELYLNVSPERQPEKQGVAIVVAGADGKLNATINSAIARKLRSDSIQIFPAYFTPQFITDGLFTKTINGDTAMFRKLNLTETLSALVLARETVQFTQDASMENLITATIKLDVVAVDVKGQFSPDTWTFTAHGPGFIKAVAVTAAEERIVKEITKATNFNLSMLK